jgi:hypothetical protein
MALNCIRSATTTSEAALKASYKLAHRITKAKNHAPTQNN